jgi:hypothetical protein
MANAGDVEIGRGLTRAVKCLRPPYDLESTKEMRGERFARMRGPLLAGACVAALVQLVGCRAHVTPGSPHTTGLITDPLYAHFPPPDPDAWDTKAPPGLEFATCQLASEETEDLLLSFLYRVAKSIDAIDSISPKHFSIDACYRAEFRLTDSNGTHTVVLAIVADDYKQSDGVVQHHLVYFASGSKQFEISYGGSYYAGYGMVAIPAAGESNPLVLVRRNEGANSRQIIYELYRVERDHLRLLWQWSKDAIGRSTAEAYSISNIDFSGITSSDHKRFTVYTTYGHLREFDDDTDLTPKHRVTSFVWNATAEAFVEEPRTNP